MTRYACAYACHMQGKADYLGINRFQKPFLKVNAYLSELAFARYASGAAREMHENWFKARSRCYLCILLSIARQWTNHAYGKNAINTYGIGF